MGKASYSPGEPCSYGQRIRVSTPDPTQHHPRPSDPIHLDSAADNQASGDTRAWTRTCWRRTSTSHPTPPSPHLRPLVPSSPRRRHAHKTAVKLMPAGASGSGPRYHGTAGPEPGRGDEKHTSPGFPCFRRPNRNQQDYSDRESRWVPSDRIEPRSFWMPNPTTPRIPRPF